MEVGEFKKLGVAASITTVRNILRRHGLGPAPGRSGQTWTEFLRAQDAVVGCDFFTVKPVLLKRLYVVFSSSFRADGCISPTVRPHPDAAWVLLQARNLVLRRDDKPLVRLLIHNRDAKFPGVFDDVFKSEAIEIIRTPIREGSQKAQSPP